MADPAITSVIDAIVERVEAIDPTIDPAAQFKRSSETSPPTTKNRRTFDLDFLGQPADLSAIGQGVQTVGLADVLASFRISVAYPIGRSEKALETTLASDSEHIRRALSRSATWAGTPVRTLRAFRSTVDWSEQEPIEQQPGLVRLVVEVTFLYRETESP